MTVNDVTLFVSHFRSQASGKDGIPQNIIAKALPTIVLYLTKVFNASLLKGIFPSEWKKSRIITLKKVNIPSSPSDFLPIALLCFLSKVLEKLAHDQVVNFLTKNKILDFEPPFLLPFFKQYKSDKLSRSPRKDLDIPSVSYNWGLHSFQVKYAQF